MKTGAINWKKKAEPAKKMCSTVCKTYFHRGVIDSTKNLYLKSKFADVHFLLDSDDGVAERVPAHKLLLANASDVFEAMFYGELKETSDIRITDASAAGFMEFLQFFYSTRVKLTIENVGEVMRLADKYNVPTCIAVCGEFLKDILCFDNIFVILNLAIQDEQQELESYCKTFITVNTTAVLKSTGFMECDKEMLAYILLMNVFSCTEIDVFDACMAWVQAKSKQTALTKEIVDLHLGDLLYEIRFRSMTMDEFCALALKYDTVLRNEFIPITHMIVQSGAIPQRFNARPRRARWNGDELVICDRTLDSVRTLYKLNTKTETIFSTTTPLLLGEITSFAVQNLRSSLPVDVEILENISWNRTNAKTLLEMKAELQSKDTNISLSYPVLIRPDFLYTIRIGKFADNHCVYSKEVKAEVRLDSDTLIKFHCYKKVRGLISALKFNKI